MYIYFFNKSKLYIVYLTQKARKGHFSWLKLKNVPGGACPQTPLGACFCLRSSSSVNRSIFFLDPCLVCTIEKKHKAP